MDLVLWQKVTAVPVAAPPLDYVGRGCVPRASFRSMPLVASPMHLAMPAAVAAQAICGAGHSAKDVATGVPASKNALHNPSRPRQKVFEGGSYFKKFPQNII